MEQLELDKQGSTEVAGKEGTPLMEEVTLLDIDALCSAVAVQPHVGKWGKLNGDSEEDNCASDHGGSVLRMWEGELLSHCFDDRRIAFQSTCCPCYRFGKNMKRAGIGSCFLQGSILILLTIIALFSLIAFIITRRRCFLYLAISFTVSIGMYLGYSRIRIRRKFNIKDGDGSLDDCIYHLVCPCCTLCQESRTLEMNNVQDGIWHGRGDRIHVGSLSSDISKQRMELSSPFVLSTKSPELHSSQKASNGSIHASSSLPYHSTLLVPPSA